MKGQKQKGRRVQEATLFFVLFPPERPGGDDHMGKGWGVGFVGAAKPPHKPHFYLAGMLLPEGDLLLLILIKSYHLVFHKVSQSRIPPLALVGI